ncbi:MAG: FAD-binding oxidoreductase [candidate division Zixibacteria bacterium]|nr:FAD-binding oxidoreductase [candidate division Zixibacteria bacterium]
MRSSADVVIIGGGIIGFSVAFHLARAKFGQIVLVDKGSVIGDGSTSQAAGGIRAQFAQKANIEMSIISENFFENFKEETGHDAFFEQVGYLFLLSDDDEVSSFKESCELQKSLGLPVELLKPDDIAKIVPHVRLDDIKLGTFCEKDGISDPWEFLSGFEKASKQMGVVVELEAEVESIDVESGKISGVRTKRGHIKTPIVINCAGPFAKKIAEMVGAEVKVEPYKRQIVNTAELTFVKPGIPMVVDVKSGLYCHKEGSGLLLGWADKEREPSFDISVEPDYTDAILERALDRIPQLETAEIANQWAGLYESTPDHQAIIGWESKVEGMFHCCGFSGHGIMHAPAAGLVTAEILAGKETTIDISSYAPERFAKGEYVVESNVI